jgi:hypothetical protein
MVVLVVEVARNLQMQVVQETLQTHLLAKAVTVVLVETLLILEAAVGEAQVVQEETELHLMAVMGDLDRLQVLLEQA